MIPGVEEIRIDRGDGVVEVHHVPTVDIDRAFDRELAEVEDGDRAEVRPRDVIACDVAAAGDYLVAAIQRDGRAGGRQRAGRHHQDHDGPFPLVGIDAAAARGRAALEFHARETGGDLSLDEDAVLIDLITDLAAAVGPEAMNTAIDFAVGHDRRARQGER